MIIEFYLYKKEGSFFCRIWLNKMRLMYAVVDVEVATGVSTPEH